MSTLTQLCGTAGRVRLGLSFTVGRAWSILTHSVRNAGETILLARSLLLLRALLGLSAPRRS
jgi:hypothetical protein